MELRAYTRPSSETELKRLWYYLCSRHENHIIYIGMLGVSVPGNGLASASKGAANTIVVEFHTEELTDSDQDYLTERDYREIRCLEHGKLR
jgi:hypothetical protein